MAGCGLHFTASKGKKASVRRHSPSERKASGCVFMCVGGGSGGGGGEGNEGFSY
jgi:hypothetical protein